MGEAEEKASHLHAEDTLDPSPLHISQPLPAPRPTEAQGFQVSTSHNMDTQLFSCLLQTVHDILLQLHSQPTGCCCPLL